MSISHFLSYSYYEFSILNMKHIKVGKCRKIFFRNISISHYYKFLNVKILFF